MGSDHTLEIFLQNFLALSTTFCPANPDVCRNFLPTITQEEEYIQLLKLKKNVIELYLTGNDDVSAVCSSLLATSLPLDSLDSSVRSCFENGVDISDTKVNKRYVYRKFRYTHAKKGSILCAEVMVSKSRSIGVVSGHIPLFLLSSTYKQNYQLLLAGHAMLKLKVIF